MRSEKRTYTEEEYRLGLLENTVSEIGETLKEIKSELKEIKSDLKDIRSEMNQGFTDIRKEMKSDFRWMLTVVVGLGASLGGIVAHGFHWF